MTAQQEKAFTTQKNNNRIGGWEDGLVGTMPDVQT